MNARSRQEDAAAGSTRPLRWFHVVLLSLPFVGLLWPAFYARTTPEWFGVPFFYTYQFLWILLSSAITGFVYLQTRRKR